MSQELTEEEYNNLEEELLKTDELWEIDTRTKFGDGEKLLLSFPAGTSRSEIRQIVRENSPLLEKVIRMRKVGLGYYNDDGELIRG
jgi:hypothetical protein